MLSPADPTDELAKLKPHHLMVAVEGEDEPRRVAVPQVRNRWSRLAALLKQLRWVTIEARDKGGGALGIVTCEARAPGAAELPDTGAVTVRERELVELMVKAQDHAVQRVVEAEERAAARVERALGRITAAMESQLDLLVKSQRIVAAQYTQALATRGALDGDDDGDEHGMDAIAPLMRLIDGKAPAKKRLIDGKAPARKTPES